MIFAYGITQQGTYHVKKDIVCQDAHHFMKCEDNMIVGAVADGLGSEQYSDIASKLAAQISVQYCADHIKPDTADESILEILCDSFLLAQKSIEVEAEKQGHEIDQYDTTLSLAVLKNGNLYYGHAGDSGIVAYAEDGRYQAVTEQQRDDMGRVFPLYFGIEKWVFGKFSKKVASVFLATDGILELLFPIYLRNEEEKLYVALAQYFMNKDVLKVEQQTEEDVQAHMAAFLQSITDDQVNDDKTVLVMLDTTVEVTRMPDAYYAEPDWAILISKYKEAWRREAYPDLYGDEANAKPATAEHEKQEGISAQGEQSTEPKAHNHNEARRTSVAACSCVDKDS